MSVKFELRPHQVELNFDWGQFENVSAKYAIEIDFVSVPFNNFFYYGPVNCSLIIGNGVYFTNTGLFIYRDGVTNIHLTEGSLNWENAFYLRYAAFDNTWPKTVKWVIDESNELVEIYFDNVLKMKFNSSVLRTMRRSIVFSYERLNNIDGIVKVSGLRMYNVT